jgi:23S rRNA pseudouridine955/2504/2580 synthase
LNHPDKRSNPGVVHSVVDAECADQRIDNFLLARLKGVPRNLVYRLIRSGQVRVNSGRVGPHYRLKAGDRVRVPPVARRAPAMPGSRITELAWLAERILYEDARLIVLDKPAGLAVHGGSGVNLGAIEALRTLRPELATAELVHRLDRATSGCLLIARRRAALRQLHAMLREGAIWKRYLALVQGDWPAGRTEIDAPLAVRRGTQGEARSTVDPHGKPARSRFEPLEFFGGLATLVAVTIPTGRTHQIRVHAAYAGHPVAGDERYGDRTFNRELQRRAGLARMFLHAQSVSFDWPDSGEHFSVSAPLPEELRSVLDALTGQISGERPSRAG